MAQSTIIELYEFQFNYLKKIVENIPNDRLYELQLDGYNSAGWILGHLCVEAEDPLSSLAINYQQVNENWLTWFRNTTANISSLDNLPTKEDLLKVLEYRYQFLADSYTSLTIEESNQPNTSTMLKKIFTSYDSWFAHHIVTHLAVHCGNLATWEKMIGLEVCGY